MENFGDSNTEKAQDRAKDVAEKVAERFADALLKSRSGTKRGLEEIPLDGTQSLKFVITEKGQIAAAKQRFGIANGESEQEHTKECFLVNNEVLRAGIDGQVEGFNNEYWFFIQLTDDNQIRIRLSPEKRGESIFGETYLRLTSSKTNCAVMPFMFVGFSQKNTVEKRIQFETSGKVMMKQTQDLAVKLAGQDKTVVQVFSDESKKIAEKQGLVANDYRNIRGGALPKFSFYRNGKEEFACFDLDKYDYAVLKKDVKGEA